jgi:hypothetical protein
MSTYIKSMFRITKYVFFNQQPPGETLLGGFLYSDLRIDTTRFKDYDADRKPITASFRACDIEMALFE